MLDFENFLILECDYFDHKEHVMRDTPSNWEYYVVSMFNKMPRMDSFNYREWPLVILHNGSEIYKNYEYFTEADWQQNEYMSKEIKKLESYGYKFEHLGYSKEEVEFFSNKYFEVLL